MDRWDFTALGGLALLSIGLWLVFAPLPFIVVGAALTYAGAAGGIRKGITTDDETKPRGVRL